jgi:CRISPR-associated endonuclease Cas2
MSSTKWHLIQYDIADPRRLRKVHRLLKTCAVAIQESVFAWQGTDSELLALQSQLVKIINKAADDIRGYRLKNPLLLFGRSPFASDCYFNNWPPWQPCPVEWLQHPPAELFV